MSDSLRLERFATRNPYFFRAPDAAEDRGLRFHIALPDGWNLREQPEWTHASEENHPLETQGWKVHVSAVPDHAEEILARSAEVAVRHRVAFKYLSTMARLIARNGKDTPREHAGKFITLYPSEEQLAELLTELDESLSGLKGPYILSDRRWKKAPVYLRYGAFQRLMLETRTGEVPALVGPDGRLVPDERSVPFRFPDWAPRPEVLESWLTGSPPNEDEPALPFDITAAIKFSTAGGTYEGTMASSGGGIVIKEARSDVCHDYDGSDAVDRLRRESRAMQALSDLPEVPGVVWTGPLWENWYLALERRRGITIRKWVINNYPAYLPSSEKFAAYLDAVLDIAIRAKDMVDRLHASGWCHHDLHFDNILVSDDHELTLIDFEFAKPAGSPAQPHVFAASGFRAPYECRPEEADWFGLRQTVAFMLLPIVQQTELIHEYSKQTRLLADYLFSGADHSGEAPSEFLSVLELLGELDRLVGGDVAEPNVNIYGSWSLGPFLETFTSPADLLQRLLAGADETREHWPHQDRMLPVHAYALDDPLTGLSYGDAGMAIGLDAALKGTKGNARHAFWRTPNSLTGLFRSAETEMDGSLFKGGMGNALALAALGAPERARDLVDSRWDAWTHSSLPRVFDGRPGMLLSGLRLHSFGALSDGMLARISDEMERIRQDYIQNAERFAPMGMVRTNTGNTPDDMSSGLLFGHLGLAWLFSEAWRALGEESFLDACNYAMTCELSSYFYDPDLQNLQLSQTTRVLPYLASGSAGFGVVLPDLPRDAVDTDVVASAPALLAATEALFSVFPGLLEGYSGLSLGNAGIRKFLGLPRRDPEHLMRVLAGYAVDSGDGIVFAGDSGLRVTGDFASGAPGIAWAVTQLCADSSDLLPRALAPRSQ
ncbi:class III lanthionine synthetase LanKC [Leifsonia sp. NPDC056824]|uniref:class III lanthionine synthetase LanKC n=1 Tax=Leifsonia sp. NPDC056824 TaxID=3345953 RepID=UPI0036B0B3F2